MTGKDSVMVFEGSNGNPVKNMFGNISLNYEGYDNAFIDKDGDEIVTSYRLLLVALNSSGFDDLMVGS